MWQRIINASSWTYNIQLFVCELVNYKTLMGLYSNIKISIRFSVYTIPRKLLKVIHPNHFNFFICLLKSICVSNNYSWGGLIFLWERKLKGFGFVLPLAFLWVLYKLRNVWIFWCYCINPLRFYSSQAHRQTIGYCKFMKMHWEKLMQFNLQW